MTHKNNIVMLKRQGATGIVDADKADFFAKHRTGGDQVIPALNTIARIELGLDVTPIEGVAITELVRHFPRRVLLAGSRGL